MKITYISDQFLPSSSADTEQFINMLSALSKQSDAELISASYRSQSEKQLKEIQDYYLVDGTWNLKFISHLFQNIRGIEKLSFAFRAALKLRNEDTNVVYTRNIPIVIATLLLTDKPVIFETFRPWPKRNIQSRWFFENMAKHPRFLGIILHSKFAKNAYLEHGYSEDQLKVEHNAFRSEFIEDIKKDKEELRKELGLSDSEPIVTYTGRVNPKKGLHYLLDLAESFAEAHFVIVGSESYGEIERRAEDMTNVTVILWQDKSSTARYIKASDILYIPTSLQAREKAMNTVLPIKTFIYKASGKAILAPDIEDLREVLVHNKTAYLVQPDDRSAAEQGLKELLENEELREKLGKEAKSEMSSLTWENRATRVIEFINRRLKNSNPIR
ncbi:MAG: glycosyltransferase family 4 protein [Gracilimonas sp.]|uniref:glycosyltransferase family 4 protein n=1 Tax=Gracilimonas sp. TaxID=1974203 RepID=UPI003753810A|nr:glycosyltransferase family 4 protein [Gracilimonas sp.]